MDYENPPEDPLPELHRWLDAAAGVGLENPHAMTLATVDGDGRPSARTVLLKGLDERGAVFYTNRRSRKGRALEAGSAATLVFYWDALGRQLTIEGPVAHVEDAESDAYFASRPRGAQLGAWASTQSEPVEGRAVLERRVLELALRYEGQAVPRPSHWGGYRVALRRVEFWESRPDRLHDRLVYRRAENGAWKAQRLCP